MFSNSLFAWLTELRVKLYCIAGGAGWLEREALEEPAEIMAGSLRLLNVMFPSTWMKGLSDISGQECCEADCKLR